jgi:NAD-dependent SIR2 family protein deacetylase
MGSVPDTVSSIAGALNQAVELLSGKKAAVLTGAGVSTDSGIPDYRGVGAPKQHPMSFSDFLGSHRHRQRYWLGSQMGWSRFASAEPNRGHQAIAWAEEQSFFTGVVTQNVDALHHKAGSLRVVDLHGRLDKVRCIHCGQSFTRQSIAATIERLNPWLGTQDISQHIKPDGDVDVEVSSDFVIPSCDMCEGVLKPEVIFFGEFVPAGIFDQAASIVARSQALIVAGSSLVVNTGMRLVNVAHKKRIPIVIINRGPTKADRLATVRIDAGTSETLDALVEGLRRSHD